MVNTAVVLPGGDGLSQLPTLPAGSPPLPFVNTVSYTNETGTAVSPPTPYDAASGTGQAQPGSGMPGPGGGEWVNGPVSHVGGTPGTVGTMYVAGQPLQAPGPANPAAASPLSPAQATQAAAKKSLPVLIVLGLLLSLVAMVLTKGKGFSIG
jgi:hypothetical protein